MRARGAAKPGIFRAEKELMQAKRQNASSEPRRVRRKTALTEADMTELHKCLQEFEHEVEHLSHSDKQKIINKIRHMNDLLHEFESSDE